MSYTSTYLFIKDEVLTMTRRQWQKHAQKKKRAGEADNDGTGPPPELACPIDRVLLREAVQTPCCHTPFCEECITTHLVEHDFECPQCESKVASLDKVRPDEEMRERVKEYMATKEQEQEGEEGVEVDLAEREKNREMTDEVKVSLSKLFITVLRLKSTV